MTNPTHAQEMAREFYVRCCEDLAVASERLNHEASKANFDRQVEAERIVSVAYKFATDDHGWTGAELVEAVIADRTTEAECVAVVL